MRRSLRLVVGIALAVAGCGPGFKPPDDTCSGGVSDGVTRFDIGSGVSGGVPFDDSQPPPTVSGGQGAPMLPVVIRIAGPSLPACLAQATRVYDDRGREIGHDTSDVATYPQGTGTRQTKPIYIVIDYLSQPMTVETHVGTLVATHHLGSGGVADMGGD